MVKLQNRLNSITELQVLHSLQDVSTDLILSLIGEKIGSGVFRSVYEYALNPEKYVIKVEPICNMCNIQEYLIWQEVQGLKGDLAWVKLWFAPIKWISPNGRILVMQRTKKIEGKEKPKMVPNFLYDAKEDNFGWIGGNYVCHDYGSIYGLINYSKKMQKPNW